MDRVEEQLNRVKRWHERFKEISNGREHTRDTDYYQDVLYAFFQNCWHLKDWVVNSGSLDKKIVDNFFHSNSDLKICRDLANGSKHLIIRDPSIDSDISVSNRKYSISIGGGPVKIEIIYYVRVKDYPPIDAFGLATNCLALCEGFLNLHRMEDKQK